MLNLPNKYVHKLPSGMKYPMVLVESGIFIMGDNLSEWDDEKPEHLVEITQPFYIGKYPVTQAIWKEVMRGHNPSYYLGDQRPVEGASWQDIVEGGQDDNVPVAFLNQLNQNYNAEILNYAFRLPTEAEWEYAAKGGHKTVLTVKQIQSFLANGKPAAAELYKVYAGSDQLKEVGWYDLNSHRETKEVGQRQPNELGLYDMSGNVFEWCQDWYDRDYYAKSKEKELVKDPVNEEAGRRRVARGGSWVYGAGHCRVSRRGHWFPASRYDRIGFRLVLAPVSTPLSPQWEI